MKYFTQSMWGALQRPDSQADQTLKTWEQATRDYRQQLSALRGRLNEEAFTFFDGADVHDGELLQLQIRDGSRPAPLSAPARPWETQLNYPVSVELSVLDAWDQVVWHLSYSGLRSTRVDFPGEDTLFYQPGEGFGDWGYHELTDAGNGFLRHEILFRSGSILAVEFRRIAVVKKPARPHLGPDRSE